MSDNVTKIEEHFLVPYHEFIDQAEFWPTLKDGATSWADQFYREPVIIAQMAPQHAVSALHKLVRWAVHAPSGSVMTIADVTAREETVRTSPLGRALANKALGLHDNELHALASGDPANINHLVGHVMAELVQRTPLEAEPAMDLALSIVTRLIDRWMIVEKP